MRRLLRGKIPWTLIWGQIRPNAVALISLFVALTSVTYSTWRNERTEYNRNVRAATFQMLTKLADFEVQKGMAINAHQVVGFVGDTGSTKGAFLYFEIRKGKDPVDPLKWLGP